MFRCVSLLLPIDCRSYPTTIFLDTS